MLCQQCKPSKRDDAYIILLGRAKVESRLIHTKQHAEDISRSLSQTVSNRYNDVSTPERAKPSVIAMFKELQ